MQKNTKPIQKPTGKSAVLSALASAGVSSTIPIGITLQYSDWISDKGHFKTELRAKFGDTTPLIVRSNASSEDQTGQSQAGRFLSVPNINTDEELNDAISRVFQSYGKGYENESVLIQEYFSNFEVVGVAFFPDPNTGSGYTVVNYAIGAETDAITSGQGNHSTWYLGPITSSAKPPVKQLALVPQAMAEARRILGWHSIDIEFGIREGKLFLFQCRPLAGVAQTISNKRLHSLIKNAEKKFASAQDTNPGILGNKTCLGLMPDWNPAEIIGVRPRPLALSLYQRLVTDRIWSRRRHQYGYRHIPSTPLLEVINGVPFVDVRKSINSLLPAQLDDAISTKITEACIAMLEERPELHDKLEFAIVPTCYQPGIIQTLSNRFSDSLTSSQLSNYADALRSLTTSILRDNISLANDEDLGLHLLRDARQKTIEPLESPFQEARFLFEICAQHGTPSFVGQARRAFIAVSMLRSFESEGITSRGFSQALLSGIETVASNFQADRLTMSYEQLMLKYGHLRPGTYDIRAFRYDEMPPEVFSKEKDIYVRPIDAPYRIGEQDRTNVDIWLAEHGFDADHSYFFEFCRRAIADRERGKFEFTRALSDGLQALVKYGQQNAIDRDELSYLSFSDIVQLASKSEDDQASICRVRTANRKARHIKYESFLPPTIVFAPEDFGSFTQSEDYPNFIGDRVLTADVTKLTEGADLNNHVVCIEGADPGYDWIFGMGVAGIVTMYGGANSHMAIRAHELGLPAVIGAGPILFQRWSNYKRIHIDPNARRVSRVS